MISIGIDVGVTGALAAIDEDGACLYLADLPITTRGALKWVDGGVLLSTLFAARRPLVGKTPRPARLFVEQTGPMPKLGMKAANSKGLTLGSVVATLQVARLPFEFVAPQRWKRALNLLRPGASDLEKKSVSLDLARQLFPNASLSRQKDNGRAEALLIAHYGQRYVMGVMAKRTASAAAKAAGELDLAS
jgi:crossover junction endodeoxyribonuclease RuvC